MTYISPILRNRLSAQTNYTSVNNNKEQHEKAYSYLQKHANDVRPNEAKAKLIKEGPIKSIISAVKDTVQDGKNFFKAVKTGEMNDNSLGRMNDLGLKVGALTIASFLAATQSKTKTDAIMRFVGGTTFVGVMSAWPKLFINLPAKLIHGFDIGQRYKNAQGDKKDFFLDNQFLPWDAYSKNELREIGKRTGIDYDSENGEEKIQRKMQKTACQNRTLWMATAGFATPLLTAVIGDKVEPYVRKQVVKHEYNKASNILGDSERLSEILSNSKPIASSQKEIEELFEGAKANGIDEKFFKDLSERLEIKNGLTDSFKNPDELRPIEAFSYSPSVEALQDLRNQKSQITSSAEDIMTELEKLLPSSKSAKTLGGKFVKKTPELGVNKEVMNEITQEIKSKNGQLTFDGLADIIAKRAEGLGFSAVGDKSAAQVAKERLSNIQGQLKYNDEGFFEAIREYNNEVLPQIRGRIKSYLKLVNPVVGENSESVNTRMYSDTMGKLFDRLDKKNFSESFEELKKARSFKGVKNAVKKMFFGTSLNLKDTANNATADIQIGYLSKMFSEIAQAPDYVEQMKKLTAVQAPENLSDVLESMFKDENLKQITNDNSELTGELSERLIRTLKSYGVVQKENTDSIRMKSLVCTNLERRIAQGSFKEAVENSKVSALKNRPLEDLTAIARRMVYDSSIAVDKCNCQEVDGKMISALKDIVFDEKQFGLEETIMPKIGDFVKKIKNLGDTNIDAKRATNLSGLVKDFATPMFENKSWKKYFLPATIALIAITLLVQPFFGNIKNEFPEKKEGGAK